MCRYRWVQVGGDAVGCRYKWCGWRLGLQQSIILVIDYSIDNSSESLSNRIKNILRTLSFYLHHSNFIEKHT